MVRKTQKKLKSRLNKTRKHNGGNLFKRLFGKTKAPSSFVPRGTRSVGLQPNIYTEADRYKDYLKSTARSAAKIL